MSDIKICELTNESVPKFPERKRDSHKGDYGRVLIIGGSFGMSGAVALAGRAAICTGSGLVKLAVPERILPMTAGYSPELMTVPLRQTRSGKIAFDAYSQIMPLVDEADVIAIGPGLGRSGGLDALLLRLNREIKKPMLIDADGLNALANYGFDRMAASFAEAMVAGAWRILTPHPGEFVRLCHDVYSEKIPRDTPGRIATACDFLTRCCDQTNVTSETSGGVVLVLKGSETIVVCNNNTPRQQAFVNTSGNPGMATGGSGDVLSGMIASLIGQRFSPFDAAKLGVYLHGRTADLAHCESQIPHESITASTLVDHIAAAIRELC